MAVNDLRSSWQFSKCVTKGFYMPSTNSDNHVNNQHFHQMIWNKESIRHRGFRDERFHRCTEHTHLSAPSGGTHPSSLTIRRNSSPRTTSSNPFPVIRFLQFCFDFCLYKVSQLFSTSSLPLLSLQSEVAISHPFPVSHYCFSVCLVN